MAKKSEDAVSAPTGLEVGDLIAQVRLWKSLRMVTGTLDVLETGEAVPVQRGSVGKVKAMVATAQGIVVYFHDKPGMPSQIGVPWGGIEFVTPATVVPEGK